MKLVTILWNDTIRCGALTDAGFALFEEPTDIGTLIERGLGRDEFAALAHTASLVLDPHTLQFLPPSVRPPKIICVGLNYAAHTAETAMAQPAYPTFFLRVATATAGHEAPLRRPQASEQFDYEGEMVVVLGKGGRHIPRDQALDCVFGYSVGNEASVRDFQFKSPQWTMGKNFDGTGAWGPYLTTADAVPAGGEGLRLETRLNGAVVQSADTRDMITSVQSAIVLLSEVMRLQAGDVLWMGTPAGVALGQQTPRWLRAGDVVEVAIEGLGTLRNPVIDDA